MQQPPCFVREGVWSSHKSETVVSNTETTFRSSICNSLSSNQPRRAVHNLWVKKYVDAVPSVLSTYLVSAAKVVISFCKVSASRLSCLTIEPPCRPRGKKAYPQLVRGLKILLAACRKIKWSFFRECHFVCKCVCVYVHVFKLG